MDDVTFHLKFALKVTDVPPLKNADFDQYLVTISAHGVNGIGLLYITVAVLL